MPKRTAYPLVFRGIEWRVDAEKGVTKSILRLYRGNKDAVRQQVTQVKADQDFCGVCLSSDIRVNEDYGNTVCASCGLSSDPPMAGAC